MLRIILKGPSFIIQQHDILKGQAHQIETFGPTVCLHASNSLSKEQSTENHFHYMYPINCLVTIILQFASLVFKFGFAVLSSIQLCVNKWWALDWKSERLRNHIPVKSAVSPCPSSLRCSLSSGRSLWVVGNECGYRSNVKYTAAIIWCGVECPKTFKAHLHQWTCYPGWTQASEKLVKTLVTLKRETAACPKRKKHMNFTCENHMLKSRVK